MAREPELVTKEQLSDKLKQILEAWPLYREFHYYGTTWGFVPLELEMYCDNPKCQKSQLWNTDLELPRPAQRWEGQPQKGKYFEKKYTCKNCGERIARFYCCWFGAAENEKGGYFVKIGQFPALSHRPPRELKKRFDEDDLSLYTKALTCRNQTYGLASVAYLRRVIENRMNDLLDLLRDVAALEKTFDAELKQIDKLKAPGTRFDDKISFAAKLLPRELLRMTDGQNPIDKLHDLASEAIHYMSEDECIKVFDRCRIIFEFVFRQLDVTMEDVKAFLSSMEGKPKAAPESQQQGK